MTHTDRTALLTWLIDLSDHARVPVSDLVQSYIEQKGEL